MAESLKTRVGRVIAGGMHALLDRIEDQSPAAVMQQALREAAGVIDEVRHDLGRVSANRHLAQQQHARLNRSHAELRDQIDLALGQLREDLVRAAVARQLDIEAQIPVLETTLADLARQEQELQGYVAALLAKQREMGQALDDFRQSRADAPGASPGQSPDARAARASEAFDRVHQRQTGLNGTQPEGGPGQAAKLQELDELARQHKIAERLAQIKAGQA